MYLVSSDVKQNRVQKQQENVKSSELLREREISTGTSTGIKETIGERKYFHKKKTVCEAMGGLPLIIYFLIFQKQQTSLIAGLRKTNEQTSDTNNDKIDKDKLESETQVND